MNFMNLLHKLPETRRKKERDWNEITTRVSGAFWVQPEAE